MTDTKQSNPVGAGQAASDAKSGEAAASSPELAPVMKISRAQATTSDVPRARAGSTSAPQDVETNGTSGRPANVSIHQGGADHVEGDTVTISQGGASVVTAGRVDVRQGGIANAQADDIRVTMGGVALARADRINVEMGGLGLSFAREAHLTQGAARSVIAQDIHVDQGLVGTAIAGHVSFEHPSPVFLLVAGRTDGPVKAMFDWRGALAFGAIFGVVVGLLRRR